MDDVVFITPFFVDTPRSFPMGTLLLATILKQQAGISSAFQHIAFPVEPLEEFLNVEEAQILATGAKIVSFYTRCDVYHLEIKIAQMLKQRHPELYVVFGGPQSDLCAEDTLREIPCVDYICRGEGEHTIVPFFKSLLAGKPDETVDGLAFIRDGQVTMNPKPPMIHDLDSLPMIDYSSMKIHDKEDAKAYSAQYYPVDVGRGCPFGCTYCSTKTFWQQNYRLKSAERIIQEIKQMHEQFGAVRFCFEHDMFTMNKKKILKICEMIQQLDFKIEWRCSARIDCIDEEMADAMVAAGMVNVFFGVETGSPRMQKLVNKNLKLEKVEPIIKYLCDLGVDVSTSFIYGFPQETPEDLGQTIELTTRLAKYDRVRVMTHLCTFLPGTELQRRYQDELTKGGAIPNIAGDIGVRECADLIDAHPRLFSQYFEYRTPLREKLKYFSRFLEEYIAFLPVYNYMAKRYEDSNLAEMYFDWAEKNSALLAGLEETSDMVHSQDMFLKDDEFLTTYRDDARYTLMCEVARYIRTERLNKLRAPKEKKDFNEVYGFCLDDYTDKKPLEAYRSGFTLTYNTYGENGSRKTVYKICDQ